MADIHIRKINKIVEGKGKLSLIYHFDLNNPKIGIIPSPISSIDSELQQTEKDALANGTRVEISKIISIKNSQTKTKIVTAIKNNWLNERTSYNSKFDFENKFYGDTIADATA